MLKESNIDRLHMNTGRRRSAASTWQSVARRHHGRYRLGLFLLAALLLLPLYSAQAAIFGGYSEYYIPGPEDEIWNIQVDIDNQGFSPSI